MKMATCHFLRDFRRAYHLKKTVEHRKRVLQRKQVADERNDHPKFTSIMEDRSMGKQVSHCQLHLFVQKYGITGVKRVYTKDQLNEARRDNLNANKQIFRWKPVWDKVYFNPDLCNLPDGTIAGKTNDVPKGIQHMRVFTIQLYAPSSIELIWNCCLL